MKVKTFVSSDPSLSEAAKAVDTEFNAWAQKSKPQVVSVATTVCPGGEGVVRMGTSRKPDVFILTALYEEKSAPVAQNSDTAISGITRLMNNQSTNE